MTVGAGTGLETEYTIATTGVAMPATAARASIEAVGPDAEEFLQGQVSNDIEALAVGEGCYAALLDPKARILGDARVLRVAEGELWLDTEVEAAAAILSELGKYRIGRQVQIEDRSAERSIVSLIGAEAAPTAATAAATSLPIPETEYGFAEGEFDGRRVLVVRTIGGVDLIVETEKADALGERLVAAGATPVSQQLAELMRIEGGRPRWGVDMTEQNLPGEAGIVERAVSFTKGCYVGQEPVARMFHKGHPNRLLRGLRLSALAQTGVALQSGEREVGKLTSVADSPRLGPIGLAIVRREAEPGDRLALAQSADTAVVVELPFGTP